jgi:hypothetical protein
MLLACLMLSLWRVSTAQSSPDVPVGVGEVIEEEEEVLVEGGGAGSDDTNNGHRSRWDVPGRLAKRSASFSHSFDIRTVKIKWRRQSDIQYKYLCA